MTTKPTRPHLLPDKKEKEQEGKQIDPVSRHWGTTAMLALETSIMTIPEIQEAIKERVNVEVNQGTLIGWLKAFNRRYKSRKGGDSGLMIPVAEVKKLIIDTMNNQN